MTNSKTVLLVDDDTLLLDSLARVLEQKDLKVQTATNGKQGLESAKNGEINLIVTDIRMPEMDGLQMVNELRKDPQIKPMPVIILSNDEQATTLNQALEAGVTVYLSKATADAEAIASQIVTALG